MNKSKLFFAVVLGTTSLCGVKASTPRLSTFPQRFRVAQPSVDAIEAQIAALKVARIGLYMKWTPRSPIVRAVEKDLWRLQKQLAQMRPFNPKLSAQAEQKAVQARIAQMESLRKSLMRRRQSRLLKAKLRHITAYISALRNRLTELRSPAAENLWQFAQNNALHEYSCKAL